MNVSGLKYKMMRFGWSLGWDFHRFSPDRSILTFVGAIVRELGISCVLDVGGHVGEYGRYLRDVGYKGRIVSFEPVRESYERLCAVAASDGNWQALPIALGAERGEARINVSKGTDLSSFMSANALAHNLLKDVEPIRTEIVPVERLDDVFDEIVQRHEKVFLKIDTQGYDLEVLAGAGACIARVLAIETELAVQPLYEGVSGLYESLKVLDGMGFVLSALFPQTRDRQLRLVECNCVLVRARAEEG